MLQSYFLPIKKKYQSNNETFWFSCHMFYIDPLTNRCCQILIQQENKEIEATLLFDSYILLDFINKFDPAKYRFALLQKNDWKFQVCKIRILKYLSKNFVKLKDFSKDFQT